MVDTVAPVCSLVQGESPFSQVPLALPSIPQASDLPSLIAAVNALRQIVLQLTGQAVSAGRGGLNNPIAFPNINVRVQNNSTINQNARKPKPGRWVEQDRETQKVRITSKDDKDVWIDILRINSLTLRDTVTGETWVWNR